MFSRTVGLLTGATTDVKYHLVGKEVFIGVDEVTVRIGANGVL